MKYKPKVVSFHFGLPSDDLLVRVRGWGAKILASATTIEEARWLESRGVDGIIAQGLEAGGHRGIFLTEDLTTQSGIFTLLPQILKNVNVPVIAAGGIADKRGVSAALLLGAVAVQVGTSYLLCKEAKTSQIHREALKCSHAHHTAVTNIFSGRPARGIVNRALKEIGEVPITVPPFPLASKAMSVLRHCAEKKGSSDFTPLWSGQNVTGCREISAKALTHELAKGYYSL
jgi:nitronate monooxygenase